MQKELSVLWGLISIKSGADYPSVNKSASYQVGNSPLDLIYQQYTSTLEQFFGVHKENEILKAITECPQLGSILFNKSNAYINGKMEVVQRTNSNPVRGVIGKSWQSLIDHPNILQNGSQFRSQVKFYVSAFGYCPVLRIMPEGFEREKNISGLWVLPPFATEVTFKKVLPFYYENFNELVESVKLKSSGKWYDMPIEDIYFFTDTTPLQTDSYLPSSRVSSLKYPINNIVKGYRTEGRIISKPLGILSGTAKDEVSMIPLDPAEKKAIQDQFNSKYGTDDPNKWDVVISNSNLRYDHMMYPVSELQLIELRGNNTAAICDGMGYPYDLMGKDKGATYSNGQNADKVLYQNHIIPEAKQLDEQFDECLYAEINNVRYVTCYDHVQALQEDAKQKAEVDMTNAKSAQLKFDANSITFGEFQTLCNATEPRIDWAKLYKYQIPELNATTTTTQNTNSGGDQANQGQA